MGMFDWLFGSPNISDPGIGRGDTRANARKNAKAKQQRAAKKAKMSGRKPVKRKGWLG